MKRCPNCGSTYANDQQKFCTKDGTPLVDAQIPSAGQGETIRIDSAQLNSTELDDDLPTKVISRELPSQAPADFDPYKTIISPSPRTSASLPRDTQDLPKPPVSQPLPPSSKSTPETRKDVIKEVPPYSPPAGEVQFVNSNKNLDSKSAEHYVDFSFYYPSSWRKDSSAGAPAAPNFAQVERSLPPNYTL